MVVAVVLFVIGGVYHVCVVQPGRITITLELHEAGKRHMQ